MQDARFRIALHRHTLLEGSGEAMRLTFRLLTDRQEHDCCMPGGANIDARYAQYLAMLTVDCGCLISEGTLVQLMTHEGGVLREAQISGPVPDPSFGSDDAQLYAQKAQEARQAGEDKIGTRNLGQEEKFAVDFGWLAGARSPESDAWLASQAYLARQEDDACTSA